MSEGYEFETKNIDNSKNHLAGSSCVAENGLRIKGRSVHRCIFVFKEKETWTCLMPMGRNEEREKGEDTEAKQNIHLS